MTNQSNYYNVIQQKYRVHNMPDTSILDLFTIGIGPSSSHTVGPMKAAREFLLRHQTCLYQAHSIKAHCFGSLALTGQGHGTDKAIMWGLLGLEPQTIHPEQALSLINDVHAQQRITLLNKHAINFNPATDITFDTSQQLSYHSNAMQLQLFDHNNHVIADDIYYSIGGGFIEREGDTKTHFQSPIQKPFPFENANQLLTHCQKHQISIADVIFENEKAIHTERHITQYLDRIIRTMLQTIDKGMATTGTITNELQQIRRAPQLAQRLKSELKDHTHSLDHLTCYAIAVGEQNAAGDIVVTSPTNGAAGIIPAVLAYYQRFHQEHHWEGDLRSFLLTAGGIGLLYKRNASISGAEMGCQGEVGVACSMAAAGLTAAMGGTALQVENAAEIAMEHNLGLTCDPVKGLVQIPCIERNAMAAVKAMNAALLALAGDGSHYISLDQAIETMRQVGVDMQSKYKETAQGGLATIATHIVNC